MKNVTAVLSALVVSTAAAVSIADEFTSTPPGSEAEKSEKLSEAAAADEQRLWELISHSEDPGDYKVFLESFPDGMYAAVARQRIAQLDGGSTAGAPPQSAAAPEIEALEGTYVVQCNANLREDATAKSSRIALLAGGKGVQVTGKVKGKNWFKVRSASGKEGFVFGPLLRPEASSTAQAAAD